MAAEPESHPNPVALHDENVRLEAIYRDHAAALRGRLTAITRNPAVADDLVGEAFLRLAVQARDGRWPDDPAAWLFRVAGNLAISRGRRQVVATRAMPGLVDRGHAESPEDEVLRRERDEVVQEALATLDGEDRELVLMAATGYRPIEIAGLTGRSREATRTRLCRARGRLRARLAATGVMA
jgi:RNA polymerase sigma factor (sigma-70 family)